MRRDTGQIITEAEAARLNAKRPGLAIPMSIFPTARQAKFGKVGRNAPCPCGSDRKFKKCCLIRKPS